MRMVVNTSDLDRLESVIPRDSGHVWPELDLECFRDAFLAILRAEHQMDPVAGI